MLPKFCGKRGIHCVLPWRPGGVLARAIKLSLACLMVSFVHNHSSKLGNYAQKNQMSLRSSSFIALAEREGFFLRCARKAT